MRVLPSFSIALLLALLLIGTTPIGTGNGAHQFDLVHPLFAHVHIVNGQVLTHDQVPQTAVVAATRTLPGPALGAGSGGNQSPGGLGISPILPTHALGLVSGLRMPRLAVTLRPPAGRMQDTPPDPPPTSAA
jgi:hypothetical protein